MLVVDECSLLRAKEKLPDGPRLLVLFDAHAKNIMRHCRWRPDSVTFICASCNLTSSVNAVEKVEEVRH